MPCRTVDSVRLLSVANVGIRPVHPETFTVSDIKRRRDHSEHSDAALVSLSVHLRTACKSKLAEFEPL